jgi:hypothetical protein
MNERKMDFIIAYNNERLFEECVFYINKLLIPEGYEIGLLGITDGKSLTSAYNEGMRASEAKYKVYLHQDVIILNRNFIADVIALFQSDASIGMMGVYGGADLPKDGCYTPFWDTGRVLCYQVFEVSELNSNVLSPFGI